VCKYSASCIYINKLWIMAKTKREYILATCFLSGAAAIISFISLGTQEWVTAIAISEVDDNENTFKFGLFGGIFKQLSITKAVYELTTVCAFGHNVCALLCGNNMENNLEDLYNNIPFNNSDLCSASAVSMEAPVFETTLLVRAYNEIDDMVFINAGVWVCTIFFLIISAVMGLLSAGLAIWNTATNPYQPYLSIFGLYVYNAIAFFSILSSVILWGAMFAKDLSRMIPSYKTYLEKFNTNGRASLGYSYWINLISICFYMVSICLLYIRNYLISKEPELKSVHIEDDVEPVLYLY
jgi:hypothetical protein